MPGRIEDYALIGDCETAALVGCDGSIDWLCWPNFDSDACFAALLGNARNGRWLIAPCDGTARVTRRYRGDSLILETRFETAEGVATLIDFMPPRGKASDIVRLVHGDRGRVAFRMELVIRFGYGADVPWVKRGTDDELLAICGPDMIVLRTPIKMRGENMTTVAAFEVAAGESIPFVMTYGASHLAVPAPVDPRHALNDTEAFWSDWSSRCTYQGDNRDLVMRSLITLKAQTFAPTGGIVAAPTTSLPETLGGARNWDYRYCWLRDAVFTLRVLIASGYTEEAACWHDWLLRAVAGSPESLQIMYGISGQRRLYEWQADWLDGYHGAQPVRIGNAAHAQLQLDVYGELIGAFHQWRASGIGIDGESWALECQVLKHLATIWDQPDSGIWERRGARKHYVTSKMMTWVAFDRAVKSAEQFGLDGPVDEWRALREVIHRDVCDHGFDEGQNAFVESYGAKVLDGSVLLMWAAGFLPPHDPRMRGTLDAVERHLVVDGLVLRHDPRENTHPDKLAEGAFLACSLWLADAYVLGGDTAKAETLFRRVAGLANDVGLLAEEYDIEARRQLGNFPQALTHIALVNTAHNLSAARGEADQPKQQRTK